MKSFFIVFIATLIVYGCTKEDDNITTFEGTVLFCSNKEPVSEGWIEIIGYEKGRFWVGWVLMHYRQNFWSTASINTDGTFNFQITTPNVDKLSIRVIKEYGGATMCNGSRDNCHELKPGKDYKDLMLCFTPDNP
jgi:hypothetical protein